MSPSSNQTPEKIDSRKNSEGYDMGELEDRELGFQSSKAGISSDSQQPIVGKTFSLFDLVGLTALFALAFWVIVNFHAAWTLPLIPIIASFFTCRFVKEAGGWVPGCAAGTLMFFLTGIALFGVLVFVDTDPTSVQGVLASFAVTVLVLVVSALGGFIGAKVFYH
jgi:hypothetical protein